MFDSHRLFTKPSTQTTLSIIDDLNKMFVSILDNVKNIPNLEKTDVVGEDIGLPRESHESTSTALTNLKTLIEDTGKILKKKNKELDSEDFSKDVKDLSKSLFNYAPEPKNRKSIKGYGNFSLGYLLEKAEYPVDIIEQTLLKVRRTSRQLWDLSESSKKESSFGSIKSIVGGIKEHGAGVAVGIIGSMIPVVGSIGVGMYGNAQDAANKRKYSDRIGTFDRNIKEEFGGSSTSGNGYSKGGGSQSERGESSQKPYGNIFQRPWEKTDPIEKLKQQQKVDQGKAEVESMFKGGGSQSDINFDTSSSRFRNKEGKFVSSSSGVKSLETTELFNFFNKNAFAALWTKDVYRFLQKIAGENEDSSEKGVAKEESGKGNSKGFNFGDLGKNVKGAVGNIGKMGSNLLGGAGKFLSSGVGSGGAGGLLGSGLAIGGAGLAGWGAGRMIGEHVKIGGKSIDEHTQNVFSGGAIGKAEAMGKVTDPKMQQKMDLIKGGMNPMEAQRKIYGDSSTIPNTDVSHTDSINKSLEQMGTKISEEKQVKRGSSGGSSSSRSFYRSINDPVMDFINMGLMGVST